MVFQFLKSCFYSTLLLTFISLSPSIATANDSGTGSQTPAFELVGSGPLVPQSPKQAIPISFKNLDSIDIEILKITEPRRFLRSYYLTDNLKGYHLRDLQRSFKSVFSDRYQLPKGKEDQFNAAQLPIPRNLAAGWYVVVVKAPGTFYKAQIRHMLLTNTGIQVRVLKNETNIYVSRLSDGAALPNMTVEVHGEGEPFSKETDKNGWVTFKRKINRQDIVVAKSSDDSAYAVLPMREVPLDLSEYSIGGRKHQTYETYIYSNRDLVKPGESLPINILLRDQDGRTAKGLSISLNVLNPSGDNVYNEELTPSDSGYYSTSIKTASDWRTGRYTVRVSLFNEDRVGGNELKFQLEEFIPERMDLVSTGGKPWAAAGKKNMFALKGRYLFGSPASGNKLDVKTSIKPIRKFSFGPNKAFLVGEAFSLPNSYAYSEDSKKLTDKGELSLAINAPSEQDVTYKSPVRVNVNLSLQESGGAAVQRQLKFDSWINKNIPGILPTRSSYSYNSMAEFDIALLSPDGQKLTSGELDVEVMYDRGPYYWTYEKGIGWSRQKQERWISNLKRTVIVKNKATRLVVPVSWGNYHLIVKDKKTNIRTVYKFYAGWYRGNTQLKAKPDHLVLDTDKKSYKAGETVKVLLSAPLDGQLSLTLDSAEKNVWRSSQPVQKGDVEIEVPLAVADLSRHDLYFTAVLTGTKASTPKRYLGVRHLMLDRSDRKLGLSITLPKRIEPMSKLNIPVEVSNIAPLQQDDTWVTVSIVDKGIINLSRYAPIDPHKYLFGQRRYETDILDLFSRQYDNRPNPFARSRFGSDGNNNTTNKNDGLVESKTVILMSKAVQIKNGKANIEFDIPDYNGEGQVIVTAFNNTQVGQRVSTSIISSKIVTELSVPRFLVPGDQSTVTVDLFNNSGDPQQFNLELVPSIGLLIQDKLLPKKLVIKDGEHWTRSVPVFIDEDQKIDTVSVNIKLSNELFAYDRSWRIPVTPIEPWVAQRKDIVLSLDEEYSTDKSLWAGLKTVTGREGRIQITTSPVLGVAEHAKGLMRYPYGCAEQTTSKAYPFLFQHPELEPLKQKAIKNRRISDDDKSVRSVIAFSVGRLKTMQKDNGAFGLWDSYSSEELWLTAYITEFLVEANTIYPGVVPSSMLTKANKRLLDYVQDISKRSQSEHTKEQDATAAYAAYILSQQGKIYYSTLGEFDLSYPTTLTNLFYTYAYTVATGKTESTEKYLDTLLVDLESGRVSRPEYFYEDYGSILRDTAKSVLVLNKMSQFPKLKNKALLLQGLLLKKLQKRLGSRRWLSTQERGALLQAAILSQTQRDQKKIEILLNGKKHTNEGQITIPLSDSLKIVNPTDSPLYIKVIAEGYLKLDPLVSNETSPFNTIKFRRLTRQMTKLGRKKPVGAEKENWLKKIKEKIFATPDDDKLTFKVGDRVLVTVAVSLKGETIPNALLVDRIPAGFVLENPELNQGVPLENILPRGIKEKLSTPSHVEYRNDRFVVSDNLYSGKYYNYLYAYVLRAEVPGEFVVPPVFLESMYSPERHAIYWQKPRYITIKR